MTVPAVVVAADSQFSPWLVESAVPSTAVPGRWPAAKERRWPGAPSGPSDLNQERKEPPVDNPTLPMWHDPLCTFHTDQPCRRRDGRVLTGPDDGDCYVQAAFESRRDAVPAR